MSIKPSIIINDYYYEMKSLPNPTHTLNVCTEQIYYCDWDAMASRYPLAKIWLNYYIKSDRLLETFWIAVLYIKKMCHQFTDECFILNLQPLGISAAVASVIVINSHVELGSTFNAFIALLNEVCSKDFITKCECVLCEFMRSFGYRIASSLYAVHHKDLLKLHGSTTFYRF